MVGADCRDGSVAINGWQTDTATSVLDLLAIFARRGVASAFVTDIASDGTMNGPSFELYRRIKSKTPQLDLIASGGVASIEDIDELDRIGCSGVIVGKAIYERNIKLEELVKYAG
ncbi:MAG: HisA/HisF-related TIM barrel protein [Pyrinomonadaceae bacterium]